MTVSLADALAPENTVLALPVCCNPCVGRQACSPCAQIVAQNHTHLRLILQREIFPLTSSEPVEVLCFWNLLTLEISFPMIFKYRNPV